MNASIITIDTKDDRAELWSMLHHLSPHRRVSFLAWCCLQAKPVMGKLPVVSVRMAATLSDAYRSDRADDRLTNEIYGDLLALSVNYDLDLLSARLELERRVRLPASVS